MHARYSPAAKNCNDLADNHHIDLVVDILLGQVTGVTPTAADSTRGVIRSDYFASSDVTTKVVTTALLYVALSGEYFYVIDIRYHTKVYTSLPPPCHRIALKC